MQSTAGARELRARMAGERWGVVLLLARAVVVSSAMRGAWTSMMAFLVGRFGLVGFIYVVLKSFCKRWSRDGLKERGAWEDRLA